MRRPQLIAIGLGTFAALAALAVVAALTLSGGGGQTAETPVAIAPTAAPTNLAQSSTPAFQVRSGPAQGDLRLPHLESVAPVATTADGLKALEPRAALVGAADQSRFNLTGASLTKGSNGQFLAEVRYASGRESSCQSALGRRPERSTLCSPSPVLSATSGKLR